MPCRACGLPCSFPRVFREARLLSLFASRWVWKLLQIRCVISILDVHGRSVFTTVVVTVPEKEIAGPQSANSVGAVAFGWNGWHCCSLLAEYSADLMMLSRSKLQCFLQFLCLDYFLLGYLLQTHFFG